MVTQHEPADALLDRDPLALLLVMLLDQQVPMERAALWRDGCDGAELPAGWRDVAGAYGEQGVFRSVADVTDAASLAKVRQYKQQTKAAAKQKSQGSQV